MALPGDLAFKIKFDLTTSPKRYEFEDTTNYAGLPVANADVRGGFKVTDPLGNIIHNNTTFTDIDGGTSFIYTGLNLPLDVNNDVMEGTHTAIYSIKTDYPIIGVNVGASTFTIAGDHAALITSSAGITVVRSTGNDATYTLVSAVFGGVNTVITVVEVIADATVDGSVQYDDQAVYEATVAVEYSDEIPTIEIDQIVDCFCGTFQSIDTTDYASNVTIVSRTHTVYYPAALVATPVVSSNATITISPIWTKTWTTKIEVSLSIDLGGGNTIDVDLVGSEEIDVECDLDLCDIACCLIALNNRYLANRTTNPIQAARDFADLTRVTQLMEMFASFSRCGKNAQASAALAEIKTVANCTDGCNCDDESPQLIVPLCGTGSGTTVQVTAGTGVTVTVSTSGGITTYQVGISASVMAIINSVAPQNVVAGAGISVAYALIGGVDTWTITNTEIYTEKNRQDLRATISFSNYAAPTVGIVVSNGLVEGANFVLATVESVNFGLGGWATENNRLKVSAFQVAGNNNYKMDVQAVEMARAFTDSDSPFPVIAADIYLGNNILICRTLNQISGEFYFQFCSDKGIPYTNKQMTQFTSIIANIQIEE
ncbi:MAG: hypothetical protein A2Z57_04430 [Planctomycetes bacterium RIFCSPHIGHO2_12_39_6]|nr:MAG: hypothetical protein A2Z57_04430 [Planctomycetes bacterium RIFCSPHIGHO2_12_39_6]